MTADGTTTPGPAAPTGTVRTVPTRSQFKIGRTIWSRAVADKAIMVGALSFYSLAIGVGIGALWPPLKDTFATLAASLGTLAPAMDQLLGGVSLATPAGWMNAEMLSILGPGFLIATALISAGAGTAGEEQGRTLGLVLSTGTSRTTFLAAKTAAMITHVLIVAAAMFAGLVLGNAIGGMGLPFGNLLAATVSMALMGLMFGSIALTIGILTGDKRLTMAITGGIAGLSFVLAVFLPLNESLLWLAKLNFWYPYSGNVAIVNGLDLSLGAVMVVSAVVISTIGFIAFPRRHDLRG